VFRSVAHIYVQAIDDASGTTVASASTTEPAIKGQLGEGDRGGFLYHGRVRAVAEAAREAGLEF
jgi:large subunit ribosomal protein L18